ncbi:Flp pilus assembly protein TadG [Marmoricola sp. URHA0025 HA25]
MSWPVPFGNPDARRDHDERGAASIEAVLVAVALGMFIALVILGGRVQMAKQAVQSAAYDAARSASISRTSSEASSSGQSSAMSSLAQQGIHCTRSNVTIDTSAFKTALGTTGSAALIQATVTCTIDVSGLGLPGINQRTITETMTSPLDSYRGRS